jgi:pilus assembly protein CpaB
MQKRTMLIGALALVFGVSAAVGVYLLAASPAASPKAEMVSLVVAAADINRGKTLTSELLTHRDWPKEAVPEGALTDLAELVDRTATVSLMKGDLLFDGKLAPRGAGRGMAAVIPTGMRAVSIQTPNVSTGVAGFILPGNRVDVLLSVSTQGSDDPTGGGSTITLLQNVEILAVDQRIDAPQDNKMDAKELRSVTLLVNPTDAAKLDLGQNKGTLHLALRNATDKGTEDVEPATLAGLKVGSPAAVAVSQKSETIPPARPKKAPLIIRTLRGSQSGFVSFPPRDDEAADSPTSTASAATADATDGAPSAADPAAPAVH